MAPKKDNIGVAKDAFVSLAVLGHQNSRVLAAGSTRFLAWATTSISTIASPLFGASFFVLVRSVGVETPQLTDVESGASHCQQRPYLLRRDARAPGFSGLRTWEDPADRCEGDQCETLLPVHAEERRPRDFPRSFAPSSRATWTPTTRWSVSVLRVVHWGSGPPS